MGDKPVRSLRTRQYDVLTAILKELRLEAGLTQDQLAQRLGQHPTYISKLERGTRRLDLVELYELAIATGHDFAKLAQRFKIQIERSEEEPHA